MKTSWRKFLYLCLLLLVIIPSKQSAAKSTSYKASNISQLFISVSPSISAKTATNYANIIISACDKYKQDPYVIAAVVVHESTVNSKAISKGGDYGLMQIRWAVHEKSIKKEFPKVKKAKDILDPKINIYYGTEVFAYCAKKGGSTREGILRYSAGNEKLADKVMNTLKELQNKDKNTNTKSNSKKK